MKYNDFIASFQKELNENGVRITQEKMKKMFEVLADYIIENIGYEENINIREFIVFRLITIPPKKLPNGEWSEQQYSIKIEMTDKYKKELKNRLNNK